jgi:hypothetical protein
MELGPGGGVAHGLRERRADGTTACPSGGKSHSHKPQLGDDLEPNVVFSVGGFQMISQRCPSGSRK